METKISAGPSFRDDKSLKAANDPYFAGPEPPAAAAALAQPAELAAPSELTTALEHSMIVSQCVV